MRLVSIVAVALALAACSNPTAQVEPDAGPPLVCARPCGATCCTEAQLCDSATSLCACKPVCDGRSCGSDGCGGICGTCPGSRKCNEDDGICYACIAKCTGKTCGDNGCGGVCGTCSATETCTAGVCSSCKADCWGRSCGTDGCGGSCGTCKGATTCDETAGTCVACAPKCTGKVCGDNGCGGSCGACKAGEACNATGQCAACAPSCTGKACGDDGCGGVCGTCKANESCNAVGQCAVVCTPDCTGRKCGDNGCGGSCGACQPSEACNSAFQCVACSPVCSGKACGDNGCGGVCGTCKSYEICAANQCTCTVSCSGKSCGDNGCGGVCGTCKAGESCTAGGQCLACAPACSGKTCGDDGCGGVCGICSSGACTAGKCVVCTANQKRCSASGTSIETCAPDGTGWAALLCSQPGRCDPASLACVASSCTPGARKCKDALVVQECAADGSAFVDRDCRTLDRYATADAKCQSDDCVDPCGTAGRAGSYQGCEFWSTVTSSSQLGTAFKGGVAVDGTQGTSVSDFALVFSNPNPAIATIKITRKKGGAEEVSPSNPVADGYGAIYVPAAGSKTVYLPWQAVGQTGQQPFAYHVASNQPVAAYQFNPLDAFTGSAKQFDTNNACTNCSYTEDASMLVPATSLTGSYVLAGQQHITIEGVTGAACATDGDCPGAGNSCTMLLFTCALPALYDQPGFFSVVAAEDNTKVTIRFSAATKASANGLPIAAQTIGSTATYALSRYDVLQFWTTAETDQAHAECFNYPSTITSWTKACRYKSDPTGTVIHAVDANNPAVEKPIGVFSGADCSFTPYSAFACDHMEEMMLPLSAWGKTYVGVKSPTYCTTANAGRCTTPIASPAPDYWRVVSSCTKASCPTGTHFTVSPAPAAGIKSAYCVGSSCALPPMDPTGSNLAAWVEFAHESDFAIAADQPVMLAQYLPGEDASATKAAEGDPSLVLAAPVEQWRTSYDLLASPTLVHNYVSLVAPAGTPNIQIDKVAVSPANFPGLQTATIGTSYAVYRVPVSGGPHSISAGGKIGVTVYGYDSYISYGYLGGTDLKKINLLPAP